MLLTFPSYRREWLTIAYLGGAMLAILLSARIACADTDETRRYSADSRDRQQVLSYAPGWVINSVMNTNDLENSKNNVSLHGDVEVNTNAVNKDKDRSAVEIDKPDLKKKTGQVVVTDQGALDADLQAKSLEVNTDTTLSEGNYDYDSINIEPGKTLTLSGGPSAEYVVKSIEGGNVNVQSGKLTVGAIVTDVLTIGAGGSVIIPPTYEGSDSVDRVADEGLGSDVKAQKDNNVPRISMTNFKPTGKASSVSMAQGSPKEVFHDSLDRQHSDEKKIDSGNAYPVSIFKPEQEKDNDMGSGDYGKKIDRSGKGEINNPESAKDDLKDSQGLTDLIKYLQSKKDRSDPEAQVLDIAQAIQEDSGSVDEETVKEFQAVVRIVGALKVIKNQLNEMDFASIIQALGSLVKERQDLYNDYLTATDSVYRRLEKLLGIDIDNTDLPDIFSTMPIITVQAKRKILVDSSIQALMAKESKNITDNDKQALDASRYTLQPMREIYLNKLKIAMQSFSTSVKKNIKDKSPASVMNEEESVKALFVLDNSASDIPNK